MLTETLDGLSRDGLAEGLGREGRFSEMDHALIKSLLDEKEEDRQPIGIPEMSQVNLIAHHCDIEITPDEMYVYSVMRKIVPTEEEIRESKKEDNIPVWRMGDQELLRQVILAIEGPEDKYQTITEKYPNIFN